MAITNVYVIEDDVDVQCALSSLLNANDLNHQCFASAKTFLEAYNPEVRGCAIIDIQLPGINGIELYQQMCRDSITLPVIMLTGHGDIQMAVAAVKAGAFDFIEKPFKPQYLLTQIRRAIQFHIESSRVLSQLSLLTPREREVLELVVEGHTTKNIAAILGSSFHTVRNQRSSILNKMNVSCVAELVGAVASAK